MKYKLNDRIKIITRELEPIDADNQLYYKYFGGLTGSVSKLYSDGIVCIDIDFDSLRNDFQKRHKEIERLEKERWISSLSEEAKRNMTGEQKQYKIAYKILVHEKDLEVYTDPE